MFAHGSSKQVKKLGNPPRKPNLRQRLFANLTLGQDQLNYALHQEKKARLFEGIAGTVLEIGPGTGVNLQFLGKGIEWIGIEPNEAMHPHLRKKAKKLGQEIKLYTEFAENTGIANDSVDFVLSTLVLCSVSDLMGTLKETERVLKPGGQFIFLEHVADMTSFLAACHTLLKKNGAMLFSTINRTPKSYIFAIVGAEYILNWLPRGTHTYQKFIKPSELDRVFRKVGFKLVELKGFEYSPFDASWKISRDCSVNYIGMAVLGP